MTDKVKVEEAKVEVKAQNTEILMRVPKDVKERARIEAELAKHYGWIKSATVTQLFIWLINYYFPLGIKKHIADREKGEEVKSG